LTNKNFAKDGCGPNQGCNFLYGHYENYRGYFYENQWVSHSGITGPVTDWLSFCYSSDESTPGNIVANGKAVGLVMGLDTIPAGAALSINGFGSQESDFEFSELAIWNAALSVDTMIAISDKMMQKINPERSISPTPSPVQVKDSPTISYDSIAGVPAWGIYRAADYSNGVLREARGNGLNANSTGLINKKYTKVGNGATSPFLVLAGNTRSTFEWPQGSIPSGDRTLCAMLRYFSYHFLTSSSY